MKVIIAYPLIYITYWIGDLFSRLAYSKFGDEYEWTYSLYNTFMNWSVALEDWNQSEIIWKKPNDTDQEISESSSK